MKSEGKIKLFKKGAKWMTDDETKEDVNEIENVIKELEKEKLYLQNKVRCCIVCVFTYCLLY